MINYRADLQILRGIAVLLVLFYHLNFVGFGNGFLGVDLFLVLSGYLMANLAETTSPLEFYKRRISRLLPAYLVTILTTSLIVLFLTVPSDANQRLSRIWFDLGGLSNIGFWLENSYFESNSFKPLLNLWSLGLEIQFYLIAPFLLKYLRKNKISNLIFFILSFIIACIFLSISPKTSFFMLPSRIWQFLIGAFVAWYPFDKKLITRKNKKFIVSILITLFFGVIFLYPLEYNSLTIINGHPGIASLIISLLTGGLISIGLDGVINEENFLSTFLIKIGNYSYSIYLTHFPIIVLLNYEPFEGTNLGIQNIKDFFFVIVLTVIASYILYNYIEKIRFSRRLNFLNLFLIFPIALTGLFGSQIKKSTLTEKEIMIIDALKDKAFYRCGKIHRVSKPWSKICEITEIDNSETILLLGDSHADSVKLAFAETLQKNNFSTSFYSSNNVFQIAEENAEFIFDQIKKSNIKKIVIHNYRNFYNVPTYIRELEYFDQLTKKFNIDTYYIAPMPDFDESIPKVMYMKILDSNFILPNETKETYLKKNSNFFDFVKRNNIKNNQIYFPHQILCNNDFCKLEENGEPIYFDSNHLTVSGSKILNPLFEKISNDLKK